MNTTHITLYFIECGLTNVQRRIVGGVETQVNQYPWMVLLMYRGRFYCGGSVISSFYVVTAAHCVDRWSQNTNKLIVIIRIFIFLIYYINTSIREIFLICCFYNTILFKNTSRINFNDFSEILCLSESAIVACSLVETKFLMAYLVLQFQVRSQSHIGADIGTRSQFHYRGKDARISCR